MNLWFEYAMTVNGTNLVVTVRWYTSSDPAAQPILTDTRQISLLDNQITADGIYQRVMDRAAEVRRGLALYQEIQSRFGAGQNTRRSAP